MNEFIKKFQAFLEKDLKIALTYKFNIVMQIFVMIFFFSLFFYTFNSSSISDDNFTSSSQYYEFFKILIGVALIDFMFSSMSVFSREIRFAQSYGTFEALMITNTSILIILLSSYALTFARSILRILIYILIGKLAFDIEISLLDLPVFFALLIFCSIPFIGIGLFAASFIIIYKIGNIINFVVGLISIFFSGIFFSTESVSDQLGSIGSNFPLTIGIDVVIKVLLEEMPIYEVMGELKRIFLLIAIFFPSGIFLVYYSLKVAKKNGSLNHY